MGTLNSGKKIWKFWKKNLENHESTIEIFVHPNDELRTPWFSPLVQLINAMERCKNMNDTFCCLSKCYGTCRCWWSCFTWITTIRFCFLSFQLECEEEAPVAAITRPLISGVSFSGDDGELDSSGIVSHSMTSDGKLLIRPPPPHRPAGDERICCWWMEDDDVNLRSLSMDVCSSSLSLLTVVSNCCCCCWSCCCCCCCCFRMASFILNQLSRLIEYLQRTSKVIIIIIIMVQYWASHWLRIELRRASYAAGV